MKFLTQVEIENCVSAYQALVGAQWQEVISNDRGLVFGLYLGQMYYFVIDMNPRGPGLFLFETVPFFKKSAKPKPLELFLKSHGLNLILEKIEIQNELGRVVLLHFAKGKKKIQLKIILIPKMPNLEASASFFDEKKQKWIEKKMFWAKPKEIKIQMHQEGQAAFRANSSESDNTESKESMVYSSGLKSAGRNQGRSLEQIHQEYLNTFIRAGQTQALVQNQEKTQAQTVTKSLTSQALDPKQIWEKEKVKKIKKKEKALLEIEKEHQSLEDEVLQQIGERLKSESLSKVLSDCQSSSTKIGLNILNPDLSAGANMELLFAKAKQLKAKKVGQLARIAILKSEIEELRNITFEQDEKSNSNLSRRAVTQEQDLMRKTGATGRKLKLTDQVFAYLGKTAKDNLNILRAAKPWDLWFHLRDYPGAHAIIHRDKNREISLEEIKKVALWVAEESLSKKALALGQSLVVVIVECRFVRPIKGDKLGRVQYHSEKQININYSPMSK